ncbi:hypothetical protein WMY93_030582 [Mugilogobius chulae]|uniref:Prolactin receptor n=1 Tax=Mugilogobius chulae TaxID=88201 RepID=A0AAW0MHR0_9GOBI
MSDPGDKKSSKHHPTSRLHPAKIPRTRDLALDGEVKKECAGLEQASPPAPSNRPAPTERQRSMDSPMTFNQDTKDSSDKQQFLSLSTPPELATDKHVELKGTLPLAQSAGPAFIPEGVSLSHTTTHFTDLVPRTLLLSLDPPSVLRPSFCPYTSFCS